MILAHPYQAFQGGDGAYVDALLRHLSACGHDIVGLTTSPNRGRPRFAFKVRYGRWMKPAWRFRGVKSFAEHEWVISPDQLGRALRTAIGMIREKLTGVAAVWQIEAGELSWLRARLEESRAEAEIYCFEAVALLGRLPTPGRKLGLMGFLPNRHYAAQGDGGQIELAQHALSSEIDSGLRAADAAAFNAVSDVTWWSGHTQGRKPSIFVGMSPGPYTALPDSEREVVLFVGNKTHPNISGLNWFLQEIWPSVLRERPQARLHVVGRVATWVEGAYVGVELIGEVEDIAQEYAKARVVVLPLIHGSAGVKTKLVEAMMLGRSFVGTSVAVEPEYMDVFSECGYVTDSAPDFAAGVLQLLSDDAERGAKQGSTKLAYDRLYSGEAAYGGILSWLSDLGAA